MSRTREITVDLPEPHLGQVEVLASKADRLVVVCGRRWGKTVVGSLKAFQAAMTTSGRYGWFAPIYPQARIGWRFMRDMASQIATVLPGVVIRDSDLEIVFPSRGSLIVRSAHDPDSLRGEGLNGVVLEEAAYLKPEVWPEIVSPMLATSAGWAMFISTPAGKNWFSDLYDRALLPSGESRPGWARWQKPTSDNPMVTAQWLEDQRHELPTLVFGQEHLAQFVDKLGALFKAEWFRYYAIEWEGNTAYIVLFPSRQRYRFTDMRRWATVDVALSLKQTADYTVVLVAGETPQGDMLVLDVIRTRLEHPDLVDLLVKVQMRWRPDYIGVEKASMGLGVIQDASRRPGMTILSLEAKGDKLQRATPVAMRMRAGKVYLDVQAPWLRDFEQELVNFTGDQGDHDDQVDALSYADTDRMNDAPSSGAIRVIE